jgi:hypothetical protein
MRIYEAYIQLGKQRIRHWSAMLIRIASVQAENHRFRVLSAMRTRTLKPYKSDLLY